MNLSVRHRKHHMPETTDTKVEETKLFSLYIHELWWAWRAERPLDYIEEPDSDVESCRLD